MNSLIKNVESSSDSVVCTVLRREDDVHFTHLGRFEFYREYADLSIVWSVDGRKLSLKARISLIIWFLRLCVSLL